MTFTLNIIKFNKLENYLKIILKENKSNNLPYHNLYHTLCVVDNVHAISTNEELSSKEIRLVMLAALFHDFNHSGGKLSDSENVKNAIEAFKTFSVESEKDNNFVVEIIKATEYPYVIKDDELSLYQKIIRDADLMQTFEKNYLQQNVIGLMEELKVDSLDKMLEGSLNFWKNCKFHTDFAKEMSMTYMPSIEKDVEFLKEILL
jgi:HD superfamily phosphodiesterase